MSQYVQSGYNINPKKSKEMARHTKYAYENPEETLHVSSNRNDTSRTGTKKPDKLHKRRMTITSKITIKNPKEPTKSAY